MSPARRSGAPARPPTPPRDTVAGLGEDGILRILARRFVTVPAADDWPTGTVGPGDDAAVVTAPDGRYVISTDAMAQDRDFRLDWPALPAGTGSGHGFGGGYSIGWKAAAQNLSDINAMGAEATGVLLALTMPGSTAAAWVDGLAAGIAGAIRHLGADRCRIVGGDLGADDRVTLAITVTGDLAGHPAATRRMAEAEAARSRDRPLDLVLCGRAGWAAAGLAVLDTPRDRLRARLHRAGDGTARLAALAAAAQLRPRPVLGAGRRAARTGAVAMMDVSDGVAKDAGRLAAANARRAELDPHWIRAEAAVLDPLAQALEADAEDWVATGGEDYGLLAVMPAGSSPPSGFRRVGQLVPGNGRDVRADAGHRDGWDHFGPAGTAP